MIFFSRVLYQYFFVLLFIILFHICFIVFSTSNINHKTELYYLYCILYKGTSTIVLHAIKYCSSILFYTILVLYTLD